VADRPRPDRGDGPPKRAPRGGRKTGSTGGPDRGPQRPANPDRPRRSPDRGGSAPRGSGGPPSDFGPGPGGSSGPRRGGPGAVPRRGFGFGRPAGDAAGPRGADSGRERPWVTGPGRGPRPGGPGGGPRGAGRGPRDAGDAGSSGRSGDGRPWDRPPGPPAERRGDRGGAPGWQARRPGQDEGRSGDRFTRDRPGPRPPFRGGPTGPRPGGSGPRPGRAFGPPLGGGFSPRPRPFVVPAGRDSGPAGRADLPPGPGSVGRPFDGRRFERPGPDDRGRGRPGPGRPWSDRTRPETGFRPAIPPPDHLGDDEELVAGRRPVEEAFVARRPAHRLLVVPQRRQALERLVLHATSLRIPVVEVEGGTLTALAGFDGHQGIALVVERRAYAGIDDVLARAVERGEPPFVLVLDSLEDPQNVGTLLRTAEAAGVHGVIFPTHRQAPLTPAAIKVSAGAVEHLLLCPVDDLPGAMTDLRGRGLRIAAAEADAPLTAAQADLRGPLAIVVGSEGQGLSPAIRRRSDVAVRIPMRGAIGSLNAAVAGSILLYAAVAQRDPEGAGDRPARPVGADPWPVRDEPGKGPDASPPTDRRSRSSDPTPARGQSVGLREPSATAETPQDVGVNEAPEADATATPAPRRGKAKARAADDAVTSVVASASAKPAKRTAAKVARTAVATKPADAAETSSKPRSRAAKKAVPDASTPTKPRRRAPTKTSKRSDVLAEPGSNAPEPDELLPGGPDPA